MNKADLINAIAEKADISKVQAKKALEALIEITTEALKKDDKVSLIGFGTFSTTMRAERMGRNPFTQKEMKIPAKKTVKFKVGSELNNL